MSRLPLLLLLLAAACSPPGRKDAEPPAQPPTDQPAEPGAETPEGAGQARADRFRAMGATFVGSGNEPGWLLAMWPDSIVLVANYGEDTLRFPPTAPEVLPTGRRLWSLEAGGRSLSLAISPEPCRDDMSGAEFPATIQYVLDSLATLRGCGTPLSE